MLKPDEIRELTDEEIEEEIARAREEIFRLNFRKSYQELDNPALLGTRKKDLARLKTIRHERRLEREREQGE
jgi:large subunit ribosomal protein L29